jgi:ribbon-helix-helix CopG family protein
MCTGRRRSWNGHFSGLATSGGARVVAAVRRLERLRHRGPEQCLRMRIWPRRSELPKVRSKNYFVTCDGATAGYCATKWPIQWKIPPTLRTNFAISAAASSEQSQIMIHTPALLGFGFPKMNFYGLSDSLATITRQPNECPHCHAAVRVSNGLRLGCFLQAGLTEDEDPYLAEIFNFFRHFASPFPEKEMRDMGKTPAVQILTISNVPSDILEAIDELAARQDRSRSSFVRRALERIVAESKAREALNKSR